MADSEVAESPTGNTESAPADEPAGRSDGEPAEPAEPADPGEHVDLRTDIPHGARVHDYFLGGKDHYLADRTAGEAILASAPWITENVRAGRNFLGRAVHLLATERGIRQFLDIGAGLPTAGNTHEVAQRAAPDARVVYVDRDPIVLAYGRALLTSTPEGTADYLLGDVREPADILARAADILDLTQPVALVLTGIMHYLHHADGPWAAVRTLSDALPADSYLVLTHLGIDNEIPSLDGAVITLDTSGYSRPLTSMVEHFYPRPLDEIKRFFYGWELLDPGVTLAPHWRAEDPELAGVWAAVARKPG